MWLIAGTASAQITINPTKSMVLDPNALVLGTGGNFSRIINGIPYQQDALVTHGDYQYSAWYRNSANEDLIIGRRDLTGDTWETFDTGIDMIHGNQDWNSHNVISMGVSGDGRVHVAFDHHVDALRYIVSDAGFATAPSNEWNATGFSAERDSLNASGTRIPRVTYPRFTNAGDDLLFTYRDRGSGNGDVRIANYDAATGLWSNTRFVNRGDVGSYDDVTNQPSTRRNAYHNAFEVDSAGRLHSTFTWRESTQNGNHDINYIYSDDLGFTWRNNDGQVVGTPSSPVNVNSPGIEVVDLDRRQSLINQQGQIVDADGRVHALMYHRRQEPGFEWQSGDGTFNRSDSAYHHYYRDPTTAQWHVNQLPTDEPVGSRPQIGVDPFGNLLGVYTSGADLIIAGAQKVGDGYADWQLLHRDQGDYEGSPLLDENRLRETGILSVFLQERADDQPVNTGTSSPLRVIEFAATTPQTPLRWIGDNSSVWSAGGATNWDIDGDIVGDLPYADGNAVRFDDNAASFNVSLSGNRSPSAVTFSNTANDYTLTGNAITGSGGVLVNGGGRVTFNSRFVNTYTGETVVEDGELVLAGGATISDSQAILVAQAGRIVSAAPLMLSSQSLTLAGEVGGSVDARDGSTVIGTGRVAGDLTTHDALIRIGEVGLLVTTGPVTTLVDDFSTSDLAAYTETRVLDQGPVDNVAFEVQQGALRSTSVGADGAEQTLLLRGDFSLEAGQELQIDTSIIEANGRDLGIVVAATDTPESATREDYAFVALTGGDSSVKIRGFDGATALPLITDSSGGPKDGLFISRVDENTFEFGHYIGEQRTVVTTHTLANAAIGAAIGFYSDQRETGSYAVLDNLRLFQAEATAAVGETFTIDGNLSLGPQSALEFGIYSPSAADRLIVGGAVSAAGSLVVTLVTGAPSPQAGDEYWLIDTQTLTGVFDSATLPTLGEGLVWDTSRLGAEGVLAVAAGLSGDFNRDGRVDAADYTVWRNTLNQSGFGLTADANNDFRVDAADYLLWRDQFGQSIFEGSNLTETANTPEPAGVSLIAIAGVMRLRHRRREP